MIYRNSSSDDSENKVSASKKKNSKTQNFEEEFFSIPKNNKTQIDKQSKLIDNLL
jgi:hypothetical protein